MCSYIHRMARLFMSPKRELEPLELAESTSTTANFSASHRSLHQSETAPLQVGSIHEPNGSVADFGSESQCSAPKTWRMQTHSAYAVAQRNLLFCRLVFVVTLYLARWSQHMVHATHCPTDRPGRDLQICAPGASPQRAVGSSG